MELIGYWRSSAAYRVRIALNLKGIEHQHRFCDLRAGDQHSEGYKLLNPQGLVPTLINAQEVRLTQSLAIIEWLEEMYPNPRLLPSDTVGRALARASAMEIACDVHPLNNLRVLNYLRGALAQPEAAVQAWIGHWISKGLESLEARFARTSGEFFFGTSPGILEICLVPQLHSARRFGIDITRYERLLRAEQAAAELLAFQRAAPEAQPDARVEAPLYRPGRR
jgi:maleylacetoacetate isomerase